MGFRRGAVSPQGWPASTGATRTFTGETQRRRRMDRHHEADGSAGKPVLVYPLCRDVHQRLREAQPPCFSEAEADWA